MRKKENLGYSYVIELPEIGKEYRDHLAYRTIIVEKILMYMPCWYQLCPQVSISYRIIGAFEHGYGLIKAKDFYNHFIAK